MHNQPIIFKRLFLTVLFATTMLAVAFTPITLPDLPVLSWVAKTGAKTFPKGQKIYSANDYGAKGDALTLNTHAIQQAIDACARAGGGIVTLKPGAYVTGSIFIKSNVILRIDKGVSILGSQHISDYQLIQTRIAGIEMKWPAALINIIDQQNAALTGDGIIDGRGKPFWDHYWAMRKTYDPKGIRWAADYDCQRPRLILISGSTNVTLRNVHLQRSGFWTVHILYSTHVTVKGLTIQNNIGGHGPSTDGIDIDSSEYVLVENCDIDCNDDDFCLKAGRDADGLRVNRPTQYVVIRHCIARKGGGLMTIGSETSGGIRHVLVEDSHAIGTSNGVNFKSAFTRGGTVEDIHIRRLLLQGVATGINLNLNWNPSYSYTTLPAGFNYDSIPSYWKVMLEKVPPSKGTPTIRNVYISQVTGTGCKKAIHAVGMKTSPLSDFHLSDIELSAHSAGEIRYARDWKIHHLLIHTEDQSQLSLKDNTGINRN